MEVAAELRGMDGAAARNLGVATGVGEPRSLVQAHFPRTLVRRSLFCQQVARRSPFRLVPPTSTGGF